MPGAGRYRHLVTIQQKSVTGRDAVGGEQTSWTTYSDWWCEARPIRGNEFVSLRAAQSDITIRFAGRYLAGVTSAMRVQWDGNTYEIAEAPIDINGRGRDMEILCRGAAQAMV